MKKNVILAALLGTASGVVATLCTKELLKLYRQAAKTGTKPESLPAPQIVVELPREQPENEIIPQDGVENEGEAPAQAVAAQAEELEDEEPHVNDGGAGSDLCYYLPQSKIWHSNDTCAYIVGKEGIVTSTVAKALAAGKKRACDRCGA